MMLLFAAALAATPIPPVTQTEVQQTALACIAVLTNDPSAREKVAVLNLTTEQRIHDFIVTCKVLEISSKMSYELGQRSARPRTY